MKMKSSRVGLPMQRVSGLVPPCPFLPLCPFWALWSELKETHCHTHSKTFTDLRAGMDQQCVLNHPLQTPT